MGDYFSVGGFGDENTFILCNMETVIVIQKQGPVDVYTPIGEGAAIAWLYRHGRVLERVQEETTYLGIPCLTLRTTTERPITITQGTNRLVTAAELVPAVDEILAGHWPHGRKPQLWDGHTAARVAADIRSRLLIAPPSVTEEAAISASSSQYVPGNA